MTNTRLDPHMTALAQRTAAAFRAEVIAQHAAALGALCTDDGAGCCVACDVSMTPCGSCGGIGYHATGCRDVEVTAETVTNKQIEDLRDALPRNHYAWQSTIDDRRACAQPIAPASPAQRAKPVRPDHQRASQGGIVMATEEVTVETVTDAMIETMRDDALVMGEYATAEICADALDLDRRGRSRVTAVERAEARKKCARMWNKRAASMKPARKPTKRELARARARVATAINARAKGGR